MDIQRFCNSLSVSEKEQIMSYLKKDLEEIEGARITVGEFLEKNGKPRNPDILNYLYKISDKHIKDIDYQFFYHTYSETRIIDKTSIRAQWFAFKSFVNEFADGLRVERID